MKFTYILLMLVFMISCGKESEVFLYDKNDPESIRLAALAKKQCINEAKVFKELDKANEFSKFKVGTLYKSIDEVKNDSRTTRYFKILSIDGPKMMIGMKSSASSENMMIEYYQEDGKEIMATVQNGICFKPKKKYSHSNLDSRSTLEFSITRKNKWTQDGKELYKQVSEVLKLEKKYPLLFLNWNGIVTNENNEIGSVVKKKHDISFDEISLSSCEAEDLCNFLDIQSYKICAVTVDTRAYDRKDIEDTLLEFSNCTSLN